MTGAPLPTPDRAAQVRRWTRRVPHRPLALAAVVALLLATTFNGYWRVSRDSSVYRGVARSLTAGEGYRFAGEPETKFYPGLPLLLAAFDRALGEDVFRPRWALLATALCAAGGLACYAAALGRAVGEAGRWAVAFAVVATAVGRDFLEAAHGLMSEGPYLLAVGATLWAFGELRASREAFGRGTSVPLSARARGAEGRGQNRVTEVTLPDGFQALDDFERRPRSRRRPVAWAVVGAAAMLAAAMLRPTFWALLAAWAGASLWCAFGLGRFGVGGDRGTEVPLPGGGSGGAARRRAFWAGVALLPVAVVLAWLALDPRPDGASVVSVSGGTYDGLVERNVRYGGALYPLVQLVRLVLSDHLPEAMFGLKLGPPAFAVVAGPLLAVAVVWLLRRGAILGLFVAATVAMHAASWSVPRYYLPVVPLLDVAWAVGVARVAVAAARWADRRSGRPGAGRSWGTGMAAGVLAVGLGGSMVLHALRFAEFAAVQRAGSLAAFIEAYRPGLADEIALSKEIARAVPAGGRVLGPEPAIESYLSNRAVDSPATLGLFAGLDERSPDPAEVRRRLDAAGVTSGVWPADAYRDRRSRWAMGEGGPIAPAPGDPVARVGEFTLRPIAPAPPAGATP